MTIKAGSRHYRDSASSFDDKNNELSSWLEDDVCGNCGAPAQPNHLYCSQECKEEDAKHVDLGNPIQDASTSNPAQTFTATSSTKETSSTTIWPEASNNAQEDTKFRYPCPQSPNIVARYNSALTSPALVALERSLPNAISSMRTNNRGSNSISSSGESSNLAQAKSSKRRSSSRSTFSSASDVVSTAHSTPQSISEVNQDGEEALDSSDFRLPPSVRPSSIMLNSTARDDKIDVTPSTSVTPDATNYSPISRITTASHNRTISSKNGSTARKTLEFARRPSTTNLPSMLPLASPMMKPFVINNGETMRRKSNRLSQAALQEVQATLKGRKAAISSSIALTDSAKNDEPISKLDLLFQDRQVVTDDSPPHLASASSSAGKTLRALSPLDTVLHSFQATVCGRYGCSGLGSSAESLEKIIVNGSLTRPSLRRHKHTHSAAAGLSFFDVNNNANLAPASSEFLVTPVIGKAQLKEESPVKQGSTDSNGTSFVEQVRAPPRGRSKARGRRSASHRSPSPARGGARRGRSEDLLRSGIEVQTSPTISPTSMRSQPVALRQSRRSTASQEESNEESIVEHRGRSLTERDIPLRSLRGRQREETTSTERSCEYLEDSCEMAWPAYGHGMKFQSGESKAGLAQKIASAILQGPKGYDDVDLDEL